MDERRKWALLAALLAVLGGGVAVVALAGGESEGGGRLIVERTFVPGTKQPELLVSVERSANVAETAKNGVSVGLICRDGQGRSVLTARVDWPFIEEPGYPRPHQHQPASDKDLKRISSCRLTGTTAPFAGRMRLRG